MNNNLSSPIQYLPISESAKFLGVSLDTLRRWDKAGIIKSKRLDGKNRYFSVDDLKKNLSNRPLSISEVSKKFNISSTTLRRLESRGIIKPLRSKAGVRVFDSATIESFMKSQYFQRKKYSLKKPKTPAKKAAQLKEALSSKKSAPIQEESTKQVSYQAPLFAGKHFLAVSSAAFVLLIVVGLGNVFLFKTQKYEVLPLPMVLGETYTAPVTDPAPQSIQPEETESISSQEVIAEVPQTPLEKYIADSLKMINEQKQKRASQSDLLRLIEISATESAKIDIHDQPSTLSSVVATARGSEVFEFLSFNSGWIELRLHESTRSGFIPEQYASVKEFEFLTPENGWTNLYESTGSGLPQVTEPKEAAGE